MMDEINTTAEDAPAATPEPKPTTPAQAATSKTPTATPDAQAATTESESISLEEARKLRSEAANLRKRLKGYEDQEKLAQEAALSEVDKASKRAAEYEQRAQQLQKQLVSAHVRMAAQSKGIIDPELAALAVQSELEYDDDGMPSNLDKVLDKLIKNKPYLAPAPAQQKQEEPTPAQTATQSAKQTPAIPAMNPGRANIQSPGTQQPGRIPTLADVYQRPSRKA